MLNITTVLAPESHSISKKKRKSEEYDEPQPGKRAKSIEAIT